VYNIEKMDYGYRHTFGGELNKDEMAQWLEESAQILSDQDGDFAVFIDIREILPISQVIQKFFQRGQNLYSNKGMTQSVVIMNNPAVKMQFKRIAVQSGILASQRYIGAISNSLWEEAALGWVVENIEPSEYFEAMAVAGV